LRFLLVLVLFLISGSVIGVLDSFGENGTLKIIKNSNFDWINYFNVTNFGPEEYSKIHSISVLNHTGMTCPMIIPPGNYSIIELGGIGLTIIEVNCDGTTVDLWPDSDGIIVQVISGSDVTCTFENFFNATIFDSGFEVESEEPKCSDSVILPPGRPFTDCFTIHLNSQGRTVSVFGLTQPELQQTRLWWIMNVFCETYPDAFIKVFEETLVPPPGCIVCEIQLEEKGLKKIQRSFPPLKQIKAGIESNEILVKEGNLLLIFEGREIPVSVTEKTAEILIKRSNFHWSYFSNSDLK